VGDDRQDQRLLPVEPFERERGRLRVLARGLGRVARGLQLDDEAAPPPGVADGAGERARIGLVAADRVERAGP
jgi:hypothetical protein